MEAQQNQDTLSGIPECSCKRGSIEFECLVEDCPNHLTQKFYCKKCLLEFKMHAH